MPEEVTDVGATGRASRPDEPLENTAHPEDSPYRASSLLSVRINKVEPGLRPVFSGCAHGSSATRGRVPPQCNVATAAGFPCHAAMFSRKPGKIKCGVAGVGSLGQHHARIYAALPGVEFVGIFETSDARAAEICAKHNCQRFATIEELGKACEAVSVVVPTDLHAKVALPLLV